MQKKQVSSSRICKIVTEPNSCNKNTKQIISEENKGKMLGINIDNNITIHDHIKIAIAKISDFLNEHKRKVLMKSVVMFNHIIWMYCQRRSNNMINRMHERS